MLTSSMFVLFFGCVIGLAVLGFIFTLFSALFGWRRRGWGGGYPGYYMRRRPLFPWLFFGGDGYRRREFFGPGPEFRHHHHHHHRPDRFGAGGNFGGGHHHHHHGGGFGGGGSFGGGHHGGHHH